MEAKYPHTFKKLNLRQRKERERERQRERETERDRERQRERQREREEKQLLSHSKITTLLSSFTKPGFITCLF